MSSKPYPDGLDCVWLALDRDDHVGAFVTGGEGPIPTILLAAGAASLESVEEMVCSMPRRSEARLLIELKRPDDFVEMAERGLFVYDWSDVHRTSSESINGYELIAAPATPLFWDDVSVEFNSILSEAVKMVGVAFSDNRVLEVRKHLTCIEA